MKTTRTTRLLVGGSFFVIILTGLVACRQKQGAGQDALSPVSLRLSWLPNVEFAGIFLAQERGFYKDAGIALTIQPGGTGLDPVQIVAGGGSDIGIAEGSQIIIGRSKAIPIVAIAALYQKSPFCYITLKESGIASVGDFRGKRIGTQPPFAFVLETMLAANGMTLKDVNMTSVGFDVRPLSEKTVDAFLSFATNEPILLALKGIDTNVILASDNGYHFYSDVIFTKEGYAQEHSALLRSFTAATIRGWQAAIDDPEAAVQLVVQKYGKGLLLEQQRQALKLNLQMITEGVSQNGIGSMNELRWTESVQTLFRYGQIDHAVDSKALFTNQFLPK